LLRLLTIGSHGLQMREIHVDRAVFIPCTSDFPGQSASAGRVPPECLSGFIGPPSKLSRLIRFGVFDRIANSKWGSGLAMIVFNLACYASVTGRMEEAKEGLRYAIDPDKAIHALALDDEDLKPPWDWIGGLK
jgi:hypothetical protein